MPVHADRCPGFPPLSFSRIRLFEPRLTIGLNSQGMVEYGDPSPCSTTVVCAADETRIAQAPPGTEKVMDWCSTVWDNTLISHPLRPSAHWKGRAMSDGPKLQAAGES